MSDQSNYRELIELYWGENRLAHGCPSCGCHKTMANVDGDNKLLPGRLCLKCARPVMVIFEDLDTPWKHSRGPWTVVETTDGDITIESEHKLIATLRVESIRLARFDAELMAAAPELLFWLNKVLDLIHIKADSKELDEAIFRALEAVSKAERWIT